MRELNHLYSHGLGAMRKLLLFVAILLVTVFGYLIAFGPTASAQQVTWSGPDVVYNDSTFQRNNSDDLPSMIGVDSGAVIFQYPNQPSTGDRVQFIYFENANDAATGNSAQHVSFVRGSGDSLSDRQGPTSVSVEPRADSSEDGDDPEETSSCQIDGVGWIVCPITTFLASGTDWLFDILTNLLEVQPLLTDTDSPMFRIWSMMLGIANLAFVIAFIIIIYSQLTSVGLNNYGVKRLLPRIIVAAVLVNISYYVCAIAVDISNILGHSLQGMFIDMRNQIVGEGGNSWQIVSWEDVATVVLSGGVAATAGLVAGVIAVTTYGPVGAIFLLLPALLGVLLAILVAILILAARQAIITVLIIIAPLAFVAYLLPNTERWFEKWRGTFMTMLLLFPIFSVLFGGAQLAGAAIIQNAGSLDVLILGMATQIAPIVITPFLIKFSGSLLGRIAGMVNNPNRGLIDRTRNFAKDQAEHRKLKRLGDVMQNEPKKHQFMRRTGRSLEMRRRKRESQRALWKAQEEEGWAKSDTYQDLQGKLEHTQHRADTAKQILSQNVKADIQGKINVEGSTLHLDNLQLEASKARLSRAQQETEALMEEYNTGSREGIPFNRDTVDAIKTIKMSNENLAFQALRKQRASFIRQKEQAELLSIADDDTENPRYEYSQEALRTAAGIDPSGKLHARADAMSKLIKMDQEEQEKSLKYLSAQAVEKKIPLKNYTATILDQAMSGDVKHDDMTVKAALSHQAADGQIAMLEKALQNENINHDDLFDVIASNVSRIKSKGGYHIQAAPQKLSIKTIIEEIKQANPTLPEAEIKLRADQEFEKRIAFNRIDTLANSSGEKIAGFKEGYLKEVTSNFDENVRLAREYARDNNISSEQIDSKLGQVHGNIHSVIHTGDLIGRIADDEAGRMKSILRDYSQYGDDSNQSDGSGGN